MTHPQKKRLSIKPKIFILSGIGIVSTIVATIMFQQWKMYAPLLENPQVSVTPAPTLPSTTIGNGVTKESFGIITTTKMATLLNVDEGNQTIAVRVGTEEITSLITPETLIEKKEITTLEDGSIHQANIPIEKSELSKLNAGDPVTIVLEKRENQIIAHEIIL